MSLFIPRGDRATANGGRLTATGGHVQPHIGRGPAVIHVLDTLRRAAPISVDGAAPSHVLYATPAIWAFIVGHGGVVLFDGLTCLGLAREPVSAIARGPTGQLVLVKA